MGKSKSLRTWKILGLYQFCNHDLITTVNGDLNQYKIVVPSFGAAYAYAATNKSTTILYYFRILTCELVFFMKYTL